MALPPHVGSPSLGVSDILYVLFRHKWKILILGALGLGGAAALIHFSTKLYQSQARLFVRYLEEENRPTLGDGNIRPTMGRGVSILSSEIAILTSFDLAQRVAETFGPEKLLDPESKAVNPKLAAAHVVHGGIGVSVAKNSSVLELSFRHTNPALVQPVLSVLVDAYLKRHLEIHRPGATFDDVFVQQTDQLKARLNQTEQELLRTRNSVGIISLDDAKKTFAARINSLRSDIMTAETQIAEREAMLKRIQAGAGVPPPTVAPASGARAEPAADVKLPIEEYQSLVGRYNGLRQRQQALLLQFTEESPRVQSINEQLSELLAKKTEMERAFPTLVAVAPAQGSPQNAPPGSMIIDPVVEAGHIAALTTRVSILKSQLEAVRAEAASVDRVELTIQELDRRRTLEESNYRYFATTLEQSRINEALSAGRVTNINQVQSPSPPSQVADSSAKMAKMLAGAGFAIAIAWAFLSELFLDRRIKRPADLRRQLGLNLFLSIPYIKKHRRVRARGRAPALTAPAGGGETAAHGAASNEIAPWEPEQDMHAYFDTLRDRVIGFFESQHLTHKPKLIALAGVGKGGGDVEVAAGLASSLSETEDGNVLFVDMTTGQGSTQQFFKGQAVNSIDDALTSKEKAQVQDKLFVVTEIGKGDRLPRALPMRFNHLIPKLKASDFDYIIFNMPPVSPISITPRLAGFMDVMLLVVESEKTNRDLVAQARDLIAESKTPVGAVLTHTRSYVPKFLGQESGD